MLEKYLFINLQKEMKRELLKLAREYVVEEIGTRFKQILEIGPLQPLIDNNIRETMKNKLRSCPRPAIFQTAMALYTASGDREPLCLCYIDEMAVLKSHMLIPNVTSEGKRKDLIKQFIVDFKPSLIVLNASAGMTNKLLMQQLETTLIPEATETIAKIKLMRRESGQYNSDDEDDDDNENEDENDPAHDDSTARSNYKPLVSISSSSILLYYH